MDARKLAKLRRELTASLGAVAGPLGHARRRRRCDAHVRGLLLDGHRKSAEPMAARPRAIERGDGDYGQALQQLLNQSRWDAGDARGGLQAWVGRQFGTAGVARPYTGTLGKVASCQVAVPLQFRCCAGGQPVRQRDRVPRATRGRRLGRRRSAAGRPRRACGGGRSNGRRTSGR